MDMRSDEGKGGKADYGLKPNMNKAKSKVGSRKDEIAGRLKGAGMPYTMSTQTGKFEEGRGMRVKMHGSEPTMSRGGGMPYDMNGPDKRVAGSRKNSRA